MARSLSIALALVLMARSSGTVLGQNEVREAIDEVVQKAVEAVEGNYADFVDANEAPLATARHSLNALVGRLNSDKKFADATKVQNALADLEKTVMQRAVPVIVGPKPKPQPVPAPAPQKSDPRHNPLQERLVGTWILPNRPDIFVFANDASGQITNTNTGKVWASGQPRFPSEEVAEVKWSNGIEWQMRFAGNDYLAVTEKDAEGKVVGDGIVPIRRK
jgi:hypothetical protein